jgi:hypothetical protein
MKERYIVKLEEGLTPDMAEGVIGLTEMQGVVEGRGEDGDANSALCMQRLDMHS